MAAAVIRNSHHSGVVAHHVEPLARAGCIAMSMNNGPQAIAPWGGRRGLFGTNPIGFAAPRADHPPLVIDMSLSKVARGKINVAAQAGDPIPPDWAFDADGNPTTDAGAAMAGTMAPVGDAKGAQLALMVEILTAALSASCFGFESSSYFTAEGAPPRAGHFLLAIDPGPFSEGRFAPRLEDLLAAIEEQPGTRLPGQRRFALREKAERDGIAVPRVLYEQLLALRGMTNRRSMPGLGAPGNDASSPRGSAAASTGRCHHGDGADRKSAPPGPRHATGADRSTRPPHGVAVRGDDDRHVVAGIGVRQPHAEHDFRHDAGLFGRALPVEVLAGVKHELVHPALVGAVDVGGAGDAPVLSTLYAEHRLGPAIVSDAPALDPDSPGVRAVHRVEDV